MGSAAARRVVLIIATLDTKSEEAIYLIERITEQGLDALVLDNGILGEPIGIVPDIPASETARAGGSTLEEARNKGSRGEAIEIMLKGATEITARLFKENRIHGDLNGRRRRRCHGRGIHAGSTARLSKTDHYAAGQRCEAVRSIYRHSGHNGHALPC